MILYIALYIILCLYYIIIKLTPQVSWVCLFTLAQDSVGLWGATCIAHMAKCKRVAFVMLVTAALRWIGSSYIYI